MLASIDEKTLEEIVSVDGKCMNSTRCIICPFKSQCLPEFLNPKPPTQNQRLEMALDVLTHNALIDSTSGVESFRSMKNSEDLA